MLTKLTQRSFIVNLLVAVVIGLLLLIGFFLSLSWLTDHGDEKRVPSVLGMNIDAASSLLQSQGFDVAVQDSVYIDTAARASVVRQSPEADVAVKKGRTVYLTVNRTVAPLVEMPDLHNFSFLSAQLYLKTIGLKVGDTSYTPDISRNAVKQQLYNGQPIAAGTKIDMGSSISLVLGDGVSDDDAMDMPEIIGMSFADAQQYLSTMNIAIGQVMPNPDVKDTANAFIFRQNPAVYSTDSTGATLRNKIREGQLIDVWLSVAPPVLDTSKRNSSPN